MKVPYMIVVGDKEEKEGVISVRHRSKGELGSVTIEGFIAMISTEIEGREG
jgi:threonyl-tRNA synthetase